MSQKIGRIKSYKTIFFNKMFIKLSVLFMLAFACNAQSYSLPKWFLNPPKNDQSKLYGVGQGVSVEDATKEALNQIASKLSVTVSSNWEKSENQITKDSSNIYNKEISTNLKSQVAEIKFNNYEVEANDVIEKQVFLLVAVDKMTLIAEKKTELSNADYSINSIYTNAQSKSIIEKAADLETVTNKILHVTPLISLISSLDSSFDPNRYFDKYNRYLAEERNIISGMHIYIVGAPGTEDLVPIVKEHLNSSKITIVPEYDSHDNNLVTLSIRSDVKKMQIYGSKMVKFYTNFELRTISDNLVASSKIETKGSSMISFNEAGKAAALELDAKIKERGILNVLGVNKETPQ